MIRGSLFICQPRPRGPRLTQWPADGRTFALDERSPALCPPPKVPGFRGAGERRKASQCDVGFNHGFQALSAPKPMLALRHVRRRQNPEGICQAAVDAGALVRVRVPAAIAALPIRERELRLHKRKSLHGRQTKRPAGPLLAAAGRERSPTDVGLALVPRHRSPRHAVTAGGGRCGCRSATP